MPTMLVTGSNRGIGLEWVRQYASAGWRVLATCRRPAEAHALQGLAAGSDRIRIEPLDVTSNQDIAGLHGALRDEPIDVLVNNAGVYLEKGTPELGGIRYDDWLRTLEVNTLGQVRMTEAFADNIAASDRKLVIVTTSHMGSIADIEAPGSYYYRSSKAALNAAARGLSAALAPRGVGVLILHPGAVRTRMGGSESRLSPEESVRAMARVVEDFRLQDSGRFFNYDGSELPW